MESPPKEVRLAETQTVLCLHVGSSGTSPTTSADAPPEIPAVLFGAYGMYSAVDWLYSRIPVRFPEIKICLSEGGIGWVAGIIDRLDHCYKYQLGYLPTWRDVEETPSEVLRRNFWFCALDDDSNMALRHRIGLEHVLVEVDGLDIHAVRARGEGPNPLPLLIGHGWPSSFAEIVPAIDLLTHPSDFAGDPADAFDVVLPADAGFYIVAPEETADTTKIALFRDWLARSVAKGSAHAREARELVGVRRSTSPS